MAMDIANYLNECCIDNAYPKDVGIKFYNDNFPSESERALLIKTYLKCHHERLIENEGIDENYEDFEKRIYPKLELEVQQCCLLNHFYWSLWALMMLNDRELCKENIYHFFYVGKRIEMYISAKQLFNL